MRATKAHVESVVKPIQDDILELKTRVQSLESQPSGSGLTGRHMQLMNVMDVSNYQIAIVAFQTNDLDQRLADLQKIVADLNPAVKPVLFGHFFSGPRNAQTVSKASFVQFASEKAAKDFLSSAGGKGCRLQTSSGLQVILEPAKSKVNATRDWAIREAERKLKARVPRSTVSVDWKARSVNVDNSPAFKQESGDLTGKFLMSFSDLSF